MENKFSVFVPRSVRKLISRIPMPWRDRIFNNIELLQFDPFLGGKMVGKLKDKRKIRIWPYRIIYKINKSAKTIIIVEVGHRGSISYD